jgi:hypothetical protein
VSVPYGVRVPLPTAAAELATARLAAVDAAAPGLVTAFWVTGSAVSGDFRPGRSDVDFVAATSRVPTLSDLEDLAAAHAERGETPVDGVYVAATALADPPSAQEPAPHLVDGEFRTGPCGLCTPAAWLELRQQGVALRGPAPAEVVPAPDQAVLSAWLRGNLHGYWSDEAAHAERVAAERPAAAPVDGSPVTWMTLGAARLLATLETGRILSKTATGGYVADRFPEYADLARRCVAWRAGSPEEFTFADGLRAAGLIRAVVSAADAAQPAV